MLDSLRSLRKDNTGYDLKQLFIGAEGTLGFITAASCKLFPQPRQTATAWLAVPDVAAALRLYGAARDSLGAENTAHAINFQPIEDFLWRQTLLHFQPGVGLVGGCP